MKSYALDDFLEDLDWCKHTCYQPMFVLINGVEYRITGAYPDCDPVETNCCELREEENHRIVFEIESKN